MKLFVNNQSTFENEVQDTKATHRIAYNNLNSEVSNGFIPINIYSRDVDKETIFELVSVKNDIAYYEYKGSFYD